MKTAETIIVRDYGDRALAVWTNEDDERVIAWVGPEPLRPIRTGVALDPDEVEALRAVL